ncbi:uncharacterized protein LOC116124059 [Pistacia vera]|uniref:uncharacterized protein LOC116124059 n=1 Tax=Pistacia vera TaxID=55513 RepID=UPI001263A479|nr:uncharacterized protein LOC116124059 [Pistacia vera]
MAGTATATFNISSTPSLLRRSSLISLSSKPSILSLRPLPKYPRIYALSSNDIKVGTNIEVDGAPWRVLEFLHVKPGKGAAFVRTKMRNYVTGNTVEKTFRAGSSTEQFRAGSPLIWNAMFSQNPFEETRINEKDVGDKTKLLKEGMDCNLLFWNGKFIAGKSFTADCCYMLKSSVRMFWLFDILKNSSYCSFINVATAVLEMV